MRVIAYQVVDGVLQDVVAGHEVVAVGCLGLDKQGKFYRVIHSCCAKPPVDINVKVALLVK